MTEQLSIHPVGSYENPRTVTTEELRETKISNLTGQMQAEIITLLGKGMDEGLSDSELEGIFENAVRGAFSWFDKG